jgi:hypothetical protein
LLFAVVRYSFPFVACFFSCSPLSLRERRSSPLVACCSSGQQPKAKGPRRPFFKASRREAYEGLCKEACSSVGEAALWSNQRQREEELGLLRNENLPLDGFAKRGLCSNAIEPLVGRGFEKRPTRPQEILSRPNSPTSPTEERNGTGSEQQATKAKTEESQGTTAQWKRATK